VVRTPEQARMLLDEVKKNTPLIDNWEQKQAGEKIDKKDPGANLP
jgi:hypothetical protein